MSRFAWIALMLGMLLGGTATAEVQGRRVEWSSPEEFQRQFELERERRYYPHAVEGRRQADGSIQYRGEYRPFPADLDEFMARWGMGEAWYREATRELQARGFSEVTHSSYLDAAGARVHQATWLRRVRPLTITPELRALQERERARLAECQAPLALLQQQRFVELERQIETLVNAADAGGVAEERLFCVLTAFGSVDPRVTRALDGFVAARPDSFVPYLLRAVHHSEAGWYERGSRFADKTTETQFEELRARVALSRRDLKELLQRAPRVMTAYQYLIVNSKANREREVARKALNAALAVNQRTLVVRHAYMISLLPRWGGSLEQMRSFAAENAEAIARYPELKVLNAMLLAEQGDQAFQVDDCATALKFYDQALQVIDYPSFHVLRAKALVRLERDDEALLALGKALAERPFLEWARAQRAHIYLRHARPEQAIADYRQLLQLFPDDPDHREQLRFAEDRLAAQKQTR